MLTAVALAIGGNGSKMARFSQSAQCTPFRDTNLFSVSEPPSPPQGRDQRAAQQ